ncbi:hypothetical protein ASPBRDRAFT_332500 [Aspergillus brasiliensis CBS 101740]|uniref:Uncharacterized protein n=1 Tax=Aspergillus brasiliensis (strain CBS 101740 / IMI 381727 / IBT 21946) TaxID=767769 RepID=A0A1L9U7K6_ASPBC|nr:hypothetical protein ASPBRDRAFT_332500 [Aspergillus brasiliensis CBS 101740]
MRIDCWRSLSPLEATDKCNVISNVGIGWRLVGVGYEVARPPGRPNPNFGFTTVLLPPSGPKLRPTLVMAGCRSLPSRSQSEESISRSNYSLGMEEEDKGRMGGWEDGRMGGFPWRACSQRELISFHMSSPNVALEIASHRACFLLLLAKSVHKPLKQDFGGSV